MVGASASAGTKMGTSRISRQDILFGLAFVVLNIIDAYLTGIALALGGTEANPIAATGFGSNMLLKGLVATAITIALVSLRKGNLVKPLSLGMLVIVLWNSFALWSWH
jgi:hypothetical protein